MKILLSLIFIIGISKVSKAYNIDTVGKYDLVILKEYPHIIKELSSQAERSDQNIINIIAIKEKDSFFLFILNKIEKNFENESHYKKLLKGARYFIINNRLYYFISEIDSKLVDKKLSIFYELDDQTIIIKFPINSKNKNYESIKISKEVLDLPSNK